MKCCTKCYFEADDRDMGHVVDCINRDCDCHDEADKWSTFIKMLERRKITNLNNGWSSNQSGPCCDSCRVDYSKPVGNMTALSGCKNPFQIAEQYGKTYCQCHIPSRKVIADKVNDALEGIIKIAKKRLNE